MSAQVSVEHHIVPKALLRPWLVESSDGQFELHGYWWNARRREMLCRRRGLSGFCFAPHLLTLDAHTDGRDAIERVFFGEVDTKGTIARDLILSHGVEALTADTRSDFARLILSLVARLPENVQLMRAHRRTLVDGLDNDPKILAAAAEHALDMKPSEMYEMTQGSLEDRALLVIQPVVDNAEVGGWFVNTSWGVKSLAPGEGTFVLADRPLVRRGGPGDSRTLWALPLTPTKAFIAAAESRHLNELLRATGPRFAKAMNSESVRRAKEYVFSVNPADAVWLGKVMAKRR
jgi:hypothetical protein